MYRFIVLVYVRTESNMACQFARPSVRQQADSCGALRAKRRYCQLKQQPVLVTIMFSAVSKIYAELSFLRHKLVSKPVSMTVNVRPKATRWSLICSTWQRRKLQNVILNSIGSTSGGETFLAVNNCTDTESQIHKKRETNTCIQRKQKYILETN